MDMKSKNNFSHYFLAKEHSPKDYFSFNFVFDDNSFKFTSCDDVFSKNQIDEGSLVLIKTLLKEKYLDGDILDMSCGYGAIGVILGKALDLPIDMCDVNSLAIKLCKINAESNCEKIGNIFESDLWQNVNKTYNHIVSNPPIKVGKKVLLDFLDGSKNHLNKGGTITIVIKKNLGADSTKKHMTELFGNCEVLQRDRGYYILRSIYN